MVKSSAQSSRCCGLAFTQVKNIKGCKKLSWNPAEDDLFEYQGLTAEFLDLFFILSFKKSTCYSEGLTRLSNNSVLHTMYKLWAGHLIVSGSFICVINVNDTLPPDFSVKFIWLGWKWQHFSRKIIYLKLISWPFWC